MPHLVIPIHPVTPEQRLIATIADLLRQGQLLLYPSDTGMAFGCALRNRAAIERIRRIRNLEETKFMTFLCPSLSDLSSYAHVSNRAYRIIRRLVPGPVTFILPATKAVPSFAHDPKRRTVGIRVPAATIPRSILTELGEPLISISATSADDAYFDPDEAVEVFGAYVDCAVTVQHHSWHTEPLFTGPSTVLDLTDDEQPRILRRGAAIEQVEELLDIEHA